MITAGSGSSSVGYIRASGSNVFFNVGTTGLWRSDGTSPGTIQILAGSPAGSIDVNGTLFFSIGGTLYTTTGTGYTTVERRHQAISRWRSSSPLPAPRATHSCVNPSGSERAR